MGGDQGNGMALVILICMVLIVLGSVALFAFAGRLLTRNLAPPRRRLVTLLMAIVGAGLGWLLVLANFYQTTLWPPPRLTFATPAGFDAPVVILLEDRRAAMTLEWQGGRLPFTAPVASIAVPPSGIVRIRDFGPMGVGGPLDVIWADGRQGRDIGGGSSAPSGTGAGEFLMIEPPDTPEFSTSLQPYDDAAIAAYIEERERRR